MPTIEELIERFRLAPLSGEGGLFRRTYCSRDMLPQSIFAGRYPEDKPAGSAILYLITQESFSRLHRLLTDEIYHFYLGDPVQLLLVPPGQAPRVVTLGQDVLNGMEVQLTVPAGWYQGSHLRAGGQWALLGTTMAPAYTDSDYTEDGAAALAEQYPAWAEEIRYLTQKQGK